jgi:hypothetical protein
MYWDQFLTQKKKYEEVWAKLKNGFTDDVRAFLDESYLVMVYQHRQMDYSVADIVNIAITQPVFIVKNPNSDEMLELAEEYNAVKDRNTAVAKKIYSKMHEIDATDIEIVKYRVEMRFPTVAIRHIQLIKQSKYVDQQLTDMRTLSIRVILKEV